jgi:hypothetical protein
MTDSTSFSQLHADFDAFLFATIGADNKGMLLSVNSALARSGVDPWEEAATLARLPAETATRNLASLIAALPEGPSARPDPGTMAARLIALLPRPAGPGIPSRTALPVFGAARSSWAVRYGIVFVIYMIVMLGTKWLGADQRAAPQGSQGIYADLPQRYFTYATIEF